MERRRPRRWGFTLIELLVVITIIVLLIALLLPVLARARAAGRFTLCLSNERQIGIGVQSYLDDFQFYYPPFVSALSGGVTQLSWLGKAGQTNWVIPAANTRFLNQYVGGPYNANAEVPVAHCPSDVLTAGNASYYDAYGSSYYANGDGGVFAPRIWSLSSGVNGPGFDLSVNASAVLSPSRMVVINESDADDLVYNSTDAGPAYYWHSADPKWNLVYGDGHAAFTPVFIGVVSNASYTYSCTQ